MKAGRRSGTGASPCGGAERPSATAIPEVAPITSSSTSTSCQSTRRAESRPLHAQLRMITQRRCMNPTPPRTSVADALATMSCPYVDPKRSAQLWTLIPALITPEAKTKAKANPATAENRRRVGSVMSVLPDRTPPPSGGGQDAGEEGQDNDASQPGRDADEVQAKGVDGALVVVRAGRVPIRAAGARTDQREDGVSAKGSARSDAEQRGGDHGGDDDDGQPGAPGLDVGRHEVDKGLGEFGVARDRLPRDVRVAEDQHPNSGEGPDGAGDGGDGQRAGECGMFRGSLSLGPAPLRFRQDPDGEHQAANHRGQSYVVKALLTGGPADQRSGSETARAAAAGEEQRSGQSHEYCGQAGELPGAANPRARHRSQTLPGRGSADVVRGFAAEGTTPLSATAARATNPSGGG